ncbi:hypothetical protein STEG23_013121, partial [Scotinomys teguina]
MLVQSASDCSVHLEIKTGDSDVAFPEVTQKVSLGTRKDLSPWAWIALTVKALSVRRECNLDSVEELLRHPARAYCHVTQVILTNQITTHLSGALPSQADLVSPADDLSLSEDLPKTWAVCTLPCGEFLLAHSSCQSVNGFIGDEPDKPSSHYPSLSISPALDTSFYR